MTMLTELSPKQSRERLRFCRSRSRYILQSNYFNKGIIIFLILECSTPPCPVFTHHCSYPCGTSSCSISPSLPYPSICPGPLHYPEMTWPASPCSPSCPSVCAPECTPFCCRTMVNHPKKTKQFPGQLASQQPENLEADEVIEDNVLQK